MSFYSYIFTLRFSSISIQQPYANVWDSIIKSWVMMIGELEYTNMFFGNGDYSDPYYRETTYAVYVIFLMLMCIILSNLLVGLAVDDVNQLRLDASRVKLRMQVGIDISCEFSL